LELGESVVTHSSAGGRKVDDKTIQPGTGADVLPWAVKTRSPQSRHLQKKSTQGVVVMSAGRETGIPLRAVPGGGRTTGLRVD